MEVEPIHQLAAALRSSPRLFACILGSGVSRAAGIRSGWEILLDLVAAHARHVDQSSDASSDPCAWYTKKYGHAPNYSEVLERLAPTSAMRRNLLEEHFMQVDPVTNARHERNPSLAHRSIASLVKRGLVRVVVTTNFDRLMERALQDAGVAQVEVVASAEQAESCYPFHACDAFVFKIHGDWKDTRLLNSREELSEYPKPIAKLLRRIVSEHGLILCGWSAESDIALRCMIAHHRLRFPAYWVNPRLDDEAKALLATRKGHYIVATGDAFFDELDLAVQESERRQVPQPLSRDIAVARARRYVADQREMELDDLLEDETRARCAWIAREFEPRDAPNADRETLLSQREEWMVACEKQSAPLASLLATIARYKQASYLATRCLSRLLAAASGSYNQVARPTGSGSQWLYAYPALLCCYAFGVASTDKDNWRGIVEATRDAGSGDAVRELRIPPHTQGYFAARWILEPFKPAPAVRLADRISNWIFSEVITWIPRRTDFERAFDRFDLYLCLLSLRPELSEWRPRCASARRDTDTPSVRLPYQEIANSLMNALRQEFGPNCMNDGLLGFDIDQTRVDKQLREWHPSST